MFLDLAENSAVVAVGIFGWLAAGCLLFAWGPKAIQLSPSEEASLFVVAIIGVLASFARLAGIVVFYAEALRSSAAEAEMTDADAEPKGQ